MGDDETRQLRDQGFFLIWMPSKNHWCWALRGSKIAPCGCRKSGHLWGWSTQAKVRKKQLTLKISWEQLPQPNKKSHTNPGEIIYIPGHMIPRLTPMRSPHFFHSSHIGTLAWTFKISVRPWTSGGSTCFLNPVGGRNCLVVRYTTVNTR